MPIFTKSIPLSLYIHMPWCVRKCPYCDFNSHELKDNLPEELYITALLHEFEHYLPLIEGRSLVSIFFGGGTPSLFSGSGIAKILDGIAQKISFTPQIEITLEANPGTIDYVRFQDFHHAGINRLSMGIQSLQDDKLKILGRIHNSEQALAAITSAKRAGFVNFNLDIMYGLPNQTLAEALTDIQKALDCAPTHFSWYQLTIEPNTLFHHQTPTLPNEDEIWEMQLAGQSLIKQYHFKQYEVSAYALDGKLCQHNLNYWEFGDYLGIGAGAHSKITDMRSAQILRAAQVKHPKEYFAVSQQGVKWQMVPENDLAFEFMLNALRLTQGVHKNIFAERTGMSFDTLKPILAKAISQKLLEENENYLCATELGRKFLNDLTALFLPTHVVPNAGALMSTKKGSPLPSAGEGLGVRVD